MGIYSRLIREFNNEYGLSEINEKRLADRISQLASIGMTNDTGSNRIAYSKEERAAKELVKKWMNEAGLEVYEDQAGNVLGRLIGKNPSLPIVLSGSHVDTVPNGGHFDGTLGVITALEVAQIWNESGFVPERSFEVVIFSDEEGVRFNGGLTGSRMMMGDVTADSLSEETDEQGISFAEALEEDGLNIGTIEESVRKPEKIYAFVELHIEQGKVLEKQNIPVGVVTGIAGPVWLEIQWTGEAGHSGNTPMGQRFDALAAASEFMAKLEELPGKYSDTAVATVGKINVFPGGINVIPGRVRLVVDIRDIYLESRDYLVMGIINLAKAIAERRGLSIEMEKKLMVNPVLIQDRMKDLVKNAVETSGFSSVFLPSGAAHDAMIMGKYVPTAMIFVRSLDGISHNPKEWTSLDDIVAGCKVLKETLYQLVR